MNNIKTQFWTPIGRFHCLLAYCRQGCLLERTCSTFITLVRLTKLHLSIC